MKGALTPRPAAAWTRPASYAAFGVMLAAVAALKLGGLLLAGLFSYMVLDLSSRRLAAAGCPPGVARWLALLLLVLALAAGTTLAVGFVRSALFSAPLILEAALPKLLQAAGQYGVELPFENLEQLRRLALRRLGENLGSIADSAGLFTAGYLRLLLSVAAAVLFFMSVFKRRVPRGIDHELVAELGDRVRGFMEGFEKVIGAQLAISAINTALTAVYLLWAGVPHFAFLLPATFILGIVPIVGNIMSNVLIIGAALTVSLELAALSLGFLVFIHTLEHFLNSRIVGGRIEAPMWLTLLSIMVGEVVLGVPGIVIAPTFLHFVREELRALPARA